MSVQRDIPELLKAGIITPDTAEKIRQYYKSKDGSSSNRLFLAFGILGALLIGLGIILIIAHNWDELSTNTKTFFSFLPLVIAQIICAFVLVRKPTNKVWKESATTFLIFAIGACNSLISQIYHISGDLSSFLLIWLLLSLPLIYIMKSSMGALLYVMGITYYVMELRYFSYLNSDSHYYWLLLLAVLPQYFILFKKQPKSNFLIIENWLIPLSLTIALATVTSDSGSLIFIAYFSLFGLLYIIGNNSFFIDKSLRNNPYKVIGSIGTLILLFMASFQGFWTDLNGEKYSFGNLITTGEFWASLVISAGALLYLYKQQKGRSFRELPPFSIIFLLFIPIFILGYFSQIPVILINLIILVLSILTITEGARRGNLGILNFGLSIITVWIIIRFINSDLSFIIRGLLLMVIGLGFFIANYLMLKRRKKND
ncbi:DUF2157 domain-containing protein [Aequorivita sp. H23M31]|uniref:DUF2157 domain-containing protein n=1 Tax=Aequorivita ciconiae TaxID=2494375 RepID=A0A410G0F7_9FLAO|nr:DUF2157 domain-containing protein [Aequorivita sp. H23M31]QAA80745.1 DUF2157 domain-containing protein [Aequorivita sp. H23M31]